MSERVKQRVFVGDISFVSLPPILLLLVLLLPVFFFIAGNE